MQAIKNAHAGTLESSDAFVQVFPISGDNIEIELESSVEEIYGDTIRELIMSILKNMNISNVRIVVQDKGALDFVIKARIQTALLRASGANEPEWSLL